MLRNYLTPSAYEALLAAKVATLKQKALGLTALPVLNPLQQDIASHPSRFKVLACGRRFGKTTLAIHVLAEHALQGEHWGYFSFTYRNLAETYRELHAALHLQTVRSSETAGRIELRGGGLIEFWSLQTSSADTARGRKYHGLIIDEAAYIPNGDYAWNGIIRPTLADETGSALIMSTPSGRNHFWYWYRRQDDPAKFPDWHSWHYPTSDNPAMKPDEMAAIERETPSLYYRQEYLAEFLENEGAVFRRIQECARLEPAEPIAGHQYMMGVDLAKQQDYTVCVVLDTTLQPVSMVYIDRFHKVDWLIQVARIKAIALRFQVETVVVDQTGLGDPIVEQLRRELYS